MSRLSELAQGYGCVEQRPACATEQHYTRMKPELVKKTCIETVEPTCNPCDPVGTSGYGNGYGVGGGYGYGGLGGYGCFWWFLLWFVILVIIVWIIIFSCKPRFCQRLGQDGEPNGEIEPGRILIWSIVIALIIIFIIWIFWCFGCGGGNRWC